jgi:hypothetical protein
MGPCYGYDELGFVLDLLATGTVVIELFDVAEHPRRFVVIFPDGTVGRMFDYDLKDV